MQKMMVGRMFIWLGAGMFANGIRYSVEGNPISELIQYAVAMLAFSYGINQIVKGGKESDSK
ncbi:hypothetical protein BK703_16630 [Bacillus thuringiensis serovar silo]|uniref:hypothetical protein n=1 Tax=Bacillus thuringiensis TaxID=1428 RepID=UPI000A3C1780|nr:hypothetical protein [Bacillus thuringiensis]MDA2128695.1 hypothetical protein [Bacillus cereus]MED3275360.1 hypothetical protein [Bacillus thuringiensis]OTW55264.1 hypothetical protein BK703_16630 [Bacillus thuringiensis serovar silo]OTW74304.1 hypothetical protein BK700_01415 [Bacillus thuringiensis serovar toguchini]